MFRILVLNSGSSSLKYALYKSCEGKIQSTTATGIISGIGESMQKIEHKSSDERSIYKAVETDLSTHKVALLKVLSLLSSGKSNVPNIDIVGHRVVHGGESLTDACLIDNKVIDCINKATPLAPLHNPHNLNGIKTAMNTLSKTVKQVAVFDTAFHSTIPKHAYLYGLPYHFYKDFGIRKYGFHGSSHEYIMKEAAIFLRKPVESLNLITCHLGAGSSICCIKNGQSIDTSMGMTPLEGLIMATRCGDIDANIVFYLMEELRISEEECKTILQQQSGWYGISGVKSALELDEAVKDGNKLAGLALETVVHRIQKYIGSYYWTLKGDVDAIVFTAGLGENWSLLRDLCLKNAEVFGFTLDSDRNNTRPNGSSLEVSSEYSSKKVLVVPTNEELFIAQKALKLAM